MANLKIDDFAKAIMAELENQAAEIGETVVSIVEEEAKAICADLKEDSTIPKRTGKYRKGFYTKVKAKGNGYVRVVVANKVYRLTHLLEYGHVTRSGSRTKAYPHWKKGQERADKIPEIIKKELGI